jgi:hypothetical protein
MLGCLRRIDQRRVEHFLVLELIAIGFFGEFLNRLHKLLLGAIDVLKLMHEQIVQRLDVPCKQSHRRILSL